MQSNSNGVQKRLAVSIKGSSQYIFKTVGRPFEMSAFYRQN